MRLSVCVCETQALCFLFTFPRTGGFTALLSNLLERFVCLAHCVELLLLPPT